MHLGGPFIIISFVVPLYASNIEALYLAKCNRMAIELKYHSVISALLAGTIMKGLGSFWSS